MGLREAFKGLFKSDKRSEYFRDLVNQRKDRQPKSDAEIMISEAEASLKAEKVQLEKDKIAFERDKLNAERMEYFSDDTDTEREESNPMDAMVQTLLMSFLMKQQGVSQSPAIPMIQPPPPPQTETPKIDTDKVNNAITLIKSKIPGKYVPIIQKQIKELSDSEVIAIIRNI